MGLPVDRLVSLPGTTAASRACGKVTSDLGCTRQKWRGNGHWRRQSNDTASICTDIILVGAELSTFSCDTLEIFLCGSVCVTNLKEEALFTNGLTVELLDNLLADFTRLKTATCISQDSHEGIMESPTEQSQHHGCCSDYHEEFCSN